MFELLSHNGHNFDILTFRPSRFSDIASYFRIFSYLALFPQKDYFAYVVVVVTRKRAPPSGWTLLLLDLCKTPSPGQDRRFGWYCYRGTDSRRSHLTHPPTERAHTDPKKISFGKNLQFNRLCLVGCWLVGWLLSTTHAEAPFGGKYKKGTETRRQLQIQDLRTKANQRRQ